MIKYYIISYYIMLFSLVVYIHIYYIISHVSNLFNHLGVICDPH